MSKQLWAKGLPLDEVLHAFTVGEDPITDLALLPFDAEGSAAHARMLGEAGLLPMEEAKALAQETVEDAVKTLEAFGPEADFLRELVRYLVDRNK